MKIIRAITFALVLGITCGVTIAVGLVTYTESRRNRDNMVYFEGFTEGYNDCQSRRKKRDTGFLPNGVTKGDTLANLTSGYRDSPE